MSGPASGPQKAIVIGLGSMGRRRLRCLRELGPTPILGVDPREDRQKQSAEMFGIPVAGQVTVEQLKAADVVVISTPPDKHTPFIAMAIEAGKPCFVEASVMLSNLEELAERADARGTLVYPSCTMRYFEGPKKIHELVRSGELGAAQSFVYHSGQWLPDWHPWEKVSDFYVSKAETGAGREIVPFELAWLTWVFGEVVTAKAQSAQKADFGLGVEDLYQILLQFSSGVFGMMQIDVLARFERRRFTLDTREGDLTWNQYRPGGPTIELRQKERDPRVLNLDEKSKTQVGVNSDKPYIDEVADFLRSARPGSPAPSYTLRDDIRVLRVLDNIRRDCQRL